MMNKSNSESYKDVLRKNNITSLYHFTDRDNLESIIQNGGLYSWHDCDCKGIVISKPGGGQLSRSLDSRDGLQSFVRVSFTKQHPMMYVAMNDGRITNPVILEIDPEVIYWQGTRYANMNATRNGANVGGELEDFEAIHFNSVKAFNHFQLDVSEQPYFQAEVLVKNFIPLKYIRNIGNFGISIPAKVAMVPSGTTQKPSVAQTFISKEAYTAQITRSTPTAFIFLIDHSASMHRTTTYNGETMTLSEAVARIVNSQIKELISRCVKSNEIRHYYDIAVIGYGADSYSAWNGMLEGRDFVSPDELSNNPYKRITTRKEVITRRGTIVKEVEEDQWFEARHDGGWTRMDKAFKKAKELLSQWMGEHQNKDCYPPTIINITDGAFNGTTKDEMLQLSNELKSMFTNDGNVILFNIHITPQNISALTFPVTKTELSGNSYGTTLCEMSSLLPIRYNAPISKLRKDIDASARHFGMAVNADMSTLLQLMDIGTPTNISNV